MIRLSGFSSHRAAWRLALICLAVNLPSAAADNKFGSASELATYLLNESGSTRGLCAVVGAETDLAVEIALQSELAVHCREPDAVAVRALRRRAAEHAIPLERLIIEQGAPGRLPYADRTVDLLIAPTLSDPALETLPCSEVLRVLRPGALAFVGCAPGAAKSLSPAALKKWHATAGTSAGLEIVDRGGRVSARVMAPRLAGAADWSHWEHGPDNNPVSGDTIIKAPYMTQFMSEPYYIAMPSVTTAAGGRTFLAIGHIAHHAREWNTLNKLIARNGHNGIMLWQRDLPEGYLVHRSAFIATPETFYLLDGSGCLLLDAETGEATGRISIPSLGGQWKWMVLNDGVLYALAGRRDPGVSTLKGDRSYGGWSWNDLSKGYYRKPHVPWGFGDTLAAYDLNENRVLWTRREEAPMDSRAMSLRDGKVYFYSPGAYLRAVDSRSGEVVWTNSDEDVLKLIEQPGRGLTSTPGFRTTCLTVATPDALIIQGQTRMNVVAVSTKDGYHLWTKKKITNNPNAIYVDGKVIMGVGTDGSHVSLEPVSGEVVEDLGFYKVACTRLTACSDSFFVRGEGTLRFDRESKRLLIDGAQRPACNDGALPANGLLYLGPWQCDCNLSLIGRVAKCAAGDFDFGHVASEDEHLRTLADDPHIVAPFETIPADWPTFRADNHRSGSTPSEVPGEVREAWQFTPPVEHTPTAPVSAGGLVVSAGLDGCVRAIDAKSGNERWTFATAGAIRAAPSIVEGRVFAGSGDGHVYALEAATGRPLWKFRAAPIERYINVYGTIGSTWPVNSGVLVRSGVAYCAAGIIDHDGTYVFALDAKTGRIKWQNNASGHLNTELRKGVSVQGNLSISGPHLLLAGGNQISPARYDLETGGFRGKSFEQGRPKANNGRYLGVFRREHTIVGGRILYSAPENVSTKGKYQVYTNGQPGTLSYGGIPPAWNRHTFVLVNYRNGKITCCDADKVAARFSKGSPETPRDRRRRAILSSAFQADEAIRWQTDLNESNKFEAVSIAVCANAVVAVVKQQQKYRSQPQWYVVALNSETGESLWKHEIFDEPLPGGLLVDRDGRVIVSMLSGSVLCLGAKSRNANS